MHHTSTLGSSEQAARLAALERENDRLRALIHLDPLTGLLNRRGFSERLSAELSRLSRGSDGLCAIMLDLDDFKAINDGLGYTSGDQVLVAVSRAMQRTLRCSDHLSRVGGDEFMALLPDTPLTGGARVAERLRCALQQLSDPTVTASLAVMALRPDDRSIDAILQQIQGALSQSKAAGKDQVTLIGLRPRLTPLTTRQQDLRRLSDGALLGVEQIFVEELLGQPVPHSIDRDLKRLAGLAPLPRSVPSHINLHPSTLLHLPLGRLQEAIGDRQVCIELREALIGPLIMELRAPTQALRRAGIQLAIDGYTGGRRGTDAVVLLQPDHLKLHPRMLSRRLASSVQRIAAVCEVLRCTLLAEGITTPQLRLLARSSGVFGGQGEGCEAPLPTARSADAVQPHL